MTWREGLNAGGDMKQHYTVGVMLRDNPDPTYRHLYHDFLFGREITRLFHEENYREGYFLDHHNFLYAPLVAWCSRQLLVIPYPYWLAAWLALSLGCFVVSALLLKKTVLVDTSWEFKSILVLCLAFPPALYTLSIYQNSLLTFAIVMSSAWLLRLKRPLAAGLVMGCAFYKPQIMPYLAIFMMLTGSWRYVAGLCVSNALWLGLGVGVCGFQAHRNWIESLLQILRGQQGDEMMTNVPWKGFVHTVFPVFLHSSAGAATYLLAGVMLGVSVYFIRKAPKIFTWTEEHTFYVALVFWMIFSAYVKPYELILALPAWFMIHNLRDDRISELRRWSLTSLFWIAVSAAVFCRFIGFSPSAPLLTTWYIAIGFLLYRPCVPHRERERYKYHFFG